MLGLLAKADVPRQRAREIVKNRIAKFMALA